MLFRSGTAGAVGATTGSAGLGSAATDAVAADDALL